MGWGSDGTGYERERPKMGSPRDQRGFFRASRLVADLVFFLGAFFTIDFGLLVGFLGVFFFAEEALPLLVDLAAEEDLAGFFRGVVFRGVFGADFAAEDAVAFLPPVALAVRVDLVGLAALAVTFFLPPVVFLLVAAALAAADGDFLLAFSAAAFSLAARLAAARVIGFSAAGGSAAGCGFFLLPRLGNRSLASGAMVSNRSRISFLNGVRWKATASG